MGSVIGSILGGVLDEEDHYRLKMGRFRDGDEREMQRLIERDWSPSLFKRLLGGGVDVGRIGYFSSRPRMPGGGTTFAFSHRWVTKRHMVPVAKNRVHFHLADVAAARACGAKWDRSVRVDGRSGSWWVSRGGSLPAGVRPSPNVQPRSTGFSLGTAAAHQGYVERDGAAAWSIGTLGETLEERRAYWGAVEEMERAGGRVQARIIAELPYEPAIGDAGRRRIVEDFCERLSELELPWWAVIHRPEKQNDPRNWHVHILFHDRPIDRWIGGDGEKTVGEREGSERRPVLARMKVQEVRAKDFVAGLRIRWSECVNAAFERAGLERRFDPRSYAEAGVAKQPGVHVGSAAMALERRGIATQRGARAVGAEIEARLAATSARLLRLAEAERERVARAVHLVEDIASGGALSSAAQALADAARRVMESGRQVRRAEAVVDLAQSLAADRPRRLAHVAHSGEEAFRQPAAEMVRRFREDGRVQVRGARRRLGMVRVRHGEALAALAGAERRMVAERLVQDLRRAREGLALMEGQFGGRVTADDWRAQMVEVVARRRAASEALAVERERTREKLLQVFGDVAPELVELALDSRRRREVVEALRVEVPRGGAPIRQALDVVEALSAAEVAHSTAEAEVRRRERIAGSPGALARLVLSQVEESGLNGARSAVKRVEGEIQANALALDVARRRGLVKDRPVERQQSRDGP